MIWIFLLILLIWAFISVFGGKVIAKAIVILFAIIAIGILLLFAREILQPEYGVRWVENTQSWERTKCIKNCWLISKDPEKEIDEFNRKWQEYESCTKLHITKPYICEIPSER